MEVNIIAVIGTVGTVCGVVFGFIGYSRGSRREVREDSREDGALKADTEYIKRRIDDVLLEQRNANITLSVHAERITRCEESSKQAHLRIDELRKEVIKDV